MDSRELTLQIDYTDTTGERQTVTRVVALTSESGSMLSSVGMPTGTRQSQDSGILVWAALAVVAAAAAAYNKYRAKKNWKMLGMILGATIILAALASFLGMSFLVMPLAFLGIAALAWFFFRPQIERSAAVVKAKLEGLRRKKGGAV